jgi:hypothetical protein
MASTSNENAMNVREASCEPLQCKRDR